MARGLCGQRRNRRPLRRVWVAAIALVTIAATTAFAWDYRFVDEPAADARDAAIRGDNAARWQAVTVLLRDVRPSVLALRDIATGTGTAADEARRALDQLHELTR